MTKLPVKRLPPNDGGRLLVRLNEKYRGGIDRYGIARLTNSNNSKSLYVLVLGHDDDTSIFMPHDIRKALGVSKGGELEFSVQKVSRIKRVLWLIETPDPAVYLPALLAVISVFLGGIGVLMTFLSLLVVL